MANPAEESIPDITDIQIRQAILEKEMYKLVQGVVANNKLTLLEINEVIQKVSGQIAKDLTEVLNPFYASRRD